MGNNLSRLFIEKENEMINKCMMRYLVLLIIKDI